MGLIELSQVNPMDLNSGYNITVIVIKMAEKSAPVFEHVLFTVPGVVSGIQRSQGTGTATSEARGKSVINQTAPGQQGSLQVSCFALPVKFKINRSFILLLTTYNLLLSCYNLNSPGCMVNFKIPVAGPFHGPACGQGAGQVDQSLVT